MDRVDCVVIGAGVVGLALARHLALRGREVVVLETEDRIGTGISSRNSEVIHAGIYYPTGSLKARLCVAGNRALYAYCAARQVDHRRCGKLIVATDEDQVEALRHLKAKAVAKAPGHPGRFDVKAISAAQRIRDFDHLVTAPLFGFSSAEDYYARCSAGLQLHRINTPTLLLSSKDDALAPPAIPDDVAKNPALDVLVTRRGGHVGFVTGSVLQPRFWAEARVLRWLQER